MASSEPAPTYHIPPRQVVAVEHPCIVRNIDRAIDMLGGPAAVKQILAPGPAKPLGLKLQPANPDSRPILSFNNPSNNLLLQIKVPKRIGKRKRGSGEPFVAVDSADCPRDARYLVQSMRDHATTSLQVEALGPIKQTHIWREMPDFVYSTQGSDFLSKVRCQLLPRDLQSIKSFQMGRKHAPLGSEAIPPPVFSTISLPHQASYRQDTSGKAWPLSGDRPSATEAAVSNKNSKNQNNSGSSSSLTTNNPNTTYNTLRSSMATVNSFADGCPTAPDPLLPPLSLQSKAIRDLHPLLVDLFKQRPLWTRRALVSQLPPEASNDRLRFVLPYVAFLIRTGPWRYCLCRFGVDPTSSPDFRIYQSVRIKTSGSKTSDEGGERAPAYGTIPTPHIFTGTHPHPRDGSIWQLCDITDPQLVPLVSLPTHELPSHCDIKCFGWYPNGTISKIRTVMKAKLDAYTARQPQQGQQQGQQPPIDNTVFNRFLALLPNQLDHFDPTTAEMGDPKFGYLPPPVTSMEMELAASYRAIAREEMNKELRRTGQIPGLINKRIGDAGGGETDDDDDNAHENGNRHHLDHLHFGNDGHHDEDGEEEGDDDNSDDDSDNSHGNSHGNSHDSNSNSDDNSDDDDDDDNDNDENDDSSSSSSD